MLTRLPITNPKYGATVVILKMHLVINKTIENRSNESLPRRENEVPLTFQIHSEIWCNSILLELELLQEERILCTLGDIRTLQRNQQGLH